jgi:hypothetical protein
MSEVVMVVSITTTSIPLSGFKAAWQQANHMNNLGQ